MTTTDKTAPWYRDALRWHGSGRRPAPGAPPVSTDYPFVRACASLMGSTPRETEALIQQARKDNAPTNAVMPRQEQQWTTMEDLRFYAKNLARDIEREVEKGQ